MNETLDHDREISYCRIFLKFSCVVQYRPKFEKQTFIDKNGKRIANFKMITNEPLLRLKTGSMSVTCQKAYTWKFVFLNYAANHTLG